MKNEIYHIAIDGPVASGKGTVAKRLAALLKIPCLDTGALYRGIAVCVRDKGVNCQDETAVVNLLPELNMKIKAQDGTTQVFVNDKDITEYLRDNEISQMTSFISRYVPVRDKMTALQQEIAQVQSFILEGRDIGSVVLPNAQFKFYLTADLKTRANRRVAELKSKGQEIPLEEMIKQIEQRDELDKTKKVGALTKVHDAILVDSTNLTTEETVQKFYDIITKTLKS